MTPIICVNEKKVKKFFSNQYQSKKNKFYVLLILVIIIQFFFISVGTSEASDKNFPVFDALLYKDKPDLSLLGLSTIRMVYDSEIWYAGESKNFPNIKKIINVANKIKPNTIVCIDIEHWPTRGDEKVVNNSIKKYKSVLSLFKYNNPSISIGYYSVVPYRDFYRALKVKGLESYEEWKLENIKLKDIAQHVDIIFPELYTFSPFRWEEYAIENLKEARKYGKPVYAFLWPMYHDSTVYKNMYVPVELWRIQLETCYKYADGIVIWGGWQRNWDENAPWWKETKHFLKAINEK